MMLVEYTEEELVVLGVGGGSRERHAASGGAAQLCLAWPGAAVCLSATPARLAQNLAPQA